MNVSSTNISWFEVANFGDLFIYINSYKIYLNGMIKQWGLVTTNSSGNGTVTFIITMSDTNYSVLLTMIKNASSASNESVMTTVKSQDKSTIKTWQANVKVDYNIIGY